MANVLSALPHAATASGSSASPEVASTPAAAAKVCRVQSRCRARLKLLEPRRCVGRNPRMRLPAHLQLQQMQQICVGCNPRTRLLAPRRPVGCDSRMRLPAH
eukprot:scaffold256235_cov14-Tisochrysis_lutea.AAC.1